MPWQEILAGFIVVAAAAYVASRLRGRADKPPRPGGPDVPLSKLTRKRPGRGSCGH